MTSKNLAEDDMSRPALKLAEQDGEYLHDAHAAITTTLADMAGAPESEWHDVASEVLDRLTNAGWHLLTAEDAEKLLNAYVTAPVALDDFLARYRPGSSNGRVWTWEDEERDILARECLCCGEAGHYQRQLEAHLAGATVVEGICAGPDGRVWDGHHRITAARRLGISWLTLESPEESAERWRRDHGEVDWHHRKFGDRHTCPTTPCEEPMHGTR